MELLYGAMICIGFWVGVGWGYGFMQTEEEKESGKPTTETVIITIIGVLLFITGMVGVVSIN